MKRGYKAPEPPKLFDKEGNEIRDLRTQLAHMSVAAGPVVPEEAKQTLYRAMFLRQTGEQPIGDVEVAFRKQNRITTWAGLEANVQRIITTDNPSGQVRLFSPIREFNHPSGKYWPSVEEARHAREDENQARAAYLQECSWAGGIDDLPVTTDLRYSNVTVVKDGDEFPVRADGTLEYPEVDDV